MLKIDMFEVMGWEHAIRGMRNPMNSWEKSDSEPGCEIVEGSSEVCRECDDAVFFKGSAFCPYNKRDFVVGYNDLDLMKRLRAAGTDHRKFMRMITVYVDITAPLYWWKEFDTYKVGTVANSCSTMHKIHSKMFTIEDFSMDQLIDENNQLMDDLEEVFGEANGILNTPIDDLRYDIEKLNMYRTLYLQTKNKTWWWQMIQRLPSSYNQKRTVMLNYEVLANIYKSRRNHKLDEWHVLCVWIEKLPYAELIIGEVKKEEK